MIPNAYNCPDGVFWLMQTPGMRPGILRDIYRLGPRRVQWRGNQTTAPHWNSDSAWLLDGQPVTVRQIESEARVAA